MEFHECIFHEQHVRLDDAKYVGCTFHNCTIYYSALSGFDLRHNSFEGGTFVLDGPAATTVQFLRALLAQPGGEEIVRGWVYGEPLP